jgi:predicted MFS family arabinose efflux permease
MRRHAALAPFGIRSFRFQWPADLLTSLAFEMETLILGWYVLVATGSVLLLTVFGSLQFLGTLIAPLLGVMSDRLGHRNVLCAMRLAYTGLAAILMALAFAGSPPPAAVLVIVALNGIVRPSDLGVRIALVAHTMPADQLIGALSVSRMTQDTARIAGALAGAGLFAAFGMGPAYLVIAGFYGLGALLTLGIGAPKPGPAAEAAPADIGSPWRDLAEGISHVRTTPRLLAVMWLAFLLNLTAYPMSNGLLPYVARDIYLIDQTGLGYLVASFAFGALIGSLVLSLADRRVALPRLMMVSTAAWYAMIIVFAHAGSVAGGIVSLVLAGFAQSFCMVGLAVMLMSTAGIRFRGRVMGVRMLAIYGLPVGLIGAGALVGRIGFPATATLYAGVGLAAMLAIAVAWRGELWRSGNGP